MTFRPSSVNMMEPRARLKMAGNKREYERTFDSKSSKACIYVAWSFLRKQVV
ncbi:hypothetical protein ABIB82_007761 [Bradyrhizobium sp. i1.8.4]